MKIQTAALGGYLLVAGGAGLMATAGYSFWSAQHSQISLMQQFVREERDYQQDSSPGAGTVASHPAAQKTTTGAANGAGGLSYPVPPPGGVLAELTAPAIGLRTVVLQGDNDSILAKGPGHLTDTALPGQPNNMIIAAHNVLYFEHIDGLKNGDPLYVTLPNGERFIYRVTGHKVISENSDIPIRPMPPTMTLVSCYPLNGSILHPPWRYLVTARLVGHTFVHLKS